MPQPKRPRRARRILTWTAVVITAAAALGLSYASVPMMAEAAPLAHAESVVTVSTTAEGTLLLPDDADGTGLVFFAGARVAPEAYADKLSGVAESGVTVVIARPTLNFAIFETRPLSTWESLAPGVTTWSIGGHSLGGVRACMYAEDPANELASLVLFGSYCSVDLSDSGLPVLSLGGENDGLSTPEKIADAAHLLPSDTEFVEIPGASHAQFGDYGTQSGDGPQEADDADVRDAITDAVGAFLGGLEQ